MIDQVSLNLDIQILIWEVLHTISQGWNISTFTNKNSDCVYTRKSVPQPHRKEHPPSHKWTDKEITEWSHARGFLCLCVLLRQPEPLWPLL